MRGNALEFSCVLTVVCAWGSGAVHADSTGQQIAGQISDVSYRHYLEDELYTHDGHDRGFGPEHDLARANIVGRFESFDLQVELHPFVWYDVVYYNVVATQVGTTYPDQILIVGAHYDSYDNPGADDNASGVAGILEIARILSQYDTENTIKYIAFDREEQWMKGSYYYALDHVLDDIVAMINLDMIAWDSGDYSVYLGGEETSDPLKYDLADAINEYAPDLLVQVIGDEPGDHQPFEFFGFQGCKVAEDDAVTMWHGEGNPCYHEPCDSVDMPDYLSYDYAMDIVRSVAGYSAEATALDIISRDCNHNGMLDSEELSFDPSADCDRNGTIDFCEPRYFDCNDNSIADFCDIASGFSDDCTGSGIPDECEPDCNETGEADSCDILNGTSSDCNANSVPDECDIAYGTSPDTDDSGLPDECELPTLNLEAAGCRYVSISPAEPGSAVIVALSVTSPDYPCLLKYAGSDGHLTDTPIFQAVDEWNTISLHGAEIVPETTYEVWPETVMNIIGAPGAVTTGMWGDAVGNYLDGEWTPPNGTIDFNDISATVDAFRHLPTAPALERCDLEPTMPNGVIDFADISYCVDAFRGASYPFAAPPACP